ncbi:MAG: hypothetical protein JXB13_09405 [Phycisphaerae bacterium]|nr:hypothetical protein [Phycisphaerae bacterium]
MLDTYPDTFTFVQYHASDGYESAWSDQRGGSFYPGWEYIPWTWFDGLTAIVGSSGFTTAYNARQQVPTDVTVALSGDPVSGTTYEVTAAVCLEAGGTAKTVRLYVVQVLDHWPTEVTYSRNGFKQAAATADLALTPGQCQTVVRSFTFDAASWASQSNIRIIAWVQQPLSTGPAEVYQAHSMSWPFPAGADCNDNGVPDLVEISQGTALDCNGNSVPDECDIDDETSDDCNGNDIPDECDLASGASDDCNTNDVPDECDVAQGLSPDCDGNIVPDECQPDCNGNGAADVCEILAGLVTDADGNGVPDECEIAPKFEAGFTTANHTTKTVTLQNTYTDPVVVCTGQYFYNGKRMIPRVSNVTANSFDLRLVDPTNASQTYSSQEVVCYWVMEKGVSELNGVKMEAWKYTSTVTDGNGDWTGEVRRYGRYYDNPVVLGQVMSANDAWSVFWTQGLRKAEMPSPTALRTGKHTGSTGLDRLPEEIGVIVFEAVTGASLGGVPFEAGVGPATVQGLLHGTPPYTPYALQTPMTAPQFVALASPAGVQADTGFWVQRHGQAGSGGSTYLLLSLDDELDRKHMTGERVAYALLKSVLAWPRVPDFDADGDVDLADFAGFQDCFGEAVTGTCLNAELSGDGLIDANDVPAFVEHMENP